MNGYVIGICLGGKPILLCVTSIIQRHGERRTITTVYPQKIYGHSRTLVVRSGVGGCCYEVRNWLVIGDVAVIKYQSFSGLPRYFY
jgi:hypothetical protein